MSYSIWFEFEQYSGSDSTDREQDYCNVILTFEDGRKQGYNVWTVEYFKDNVHTLLSNAEQNGYAVCPDIIVSHIQRESITEVLKQLMGQ